MSQKQVFEWAWTQELGRLNNLHCCDCCDSNYCSMCGTQLWKCDCAKDSYRLDGVYDYNTSKKEYEVSCAKK